MSHRPRYFVILGAMRTGSNLLEKTLEALGDTVCYGEAFNPAFIGGPLKGDVLGWSRKRRDRDPIGFLDAMIEAAGARIPGFRLFNDHAPAVMAHVLADPDCARIVLRRDPLDSFVSLGIARATDQWMLRKARRRTTMKVHFDADAFVRYRAALQAHYDGIEAALDRAGQGAFRVLYRQLTEAGVMQAIAAHIGSGGTVPDAPPILRQNPVDLADKVSNYGDLCTFLGAPPPVCGPDARRAILYAAKAPLGFVAIPGPGMDAGLLLMQRVDALGFGADPIVPGQIIGGAEPERLFPASAGPSPRDLFTVLCHPVRRLHAAFVDELFGPGWFHAPIRRHLARLHGGLPSPKVIASDPATFAHDLHRRCFVDYLGLVGEAQKGDGVFPMQDCWRAQAAFLADRPASLVRLRLDGFEADAARFCRHHKVAPIPPGQHQRLAMLGTLSDHRIEDLIDADLTARVRALSPEDFEPLGYSDAL